MGHLISKFREPPPSAVCQSSIDALSDDQLYALIGAVGDEDAIGFKETPGTWGDSEVHRITHDAVVKYGHDAETFAMRYVSSFTSIPIPRVRRILPVLENDPNFTPDGEWIVMDLVDGEPLVRAWPTLSWWGRLRVIWYMRSYMQQLRRVPIPVPDQPGPMHPSGKPMVCFGSYFGGGPSSGPFHSYKDMADWYDRCRFHALVVWHQTEGEMLRCLKFDRTHPLVVCHMELNMRNIMVDRKGIPWIIDWGEAGVYPTWFEYCMATCWISTSPYSEWQAPWLWRWSLTFMFGNYRKYFTDFFYPLVPLWSYGVEDWPLDYFEKEGINDN